MSATNDDARQAWDANAASWDSHMGDGNDFFEMLVWPPVSRLLSQCSPASTCSTWHAATA